MPDCGIAVPFIAGPGTFRIDVVGESFYASSFDAICGPRTIEGVKVEARALLTLLDNNPYDNRAVSVSIQGQQVGHLSREDARSFRRSVRYGPMSVHEAFDCAALIRGGWDRGGNDTGEYGVRLDLKLDDD